MLTARNIIVQIINVIMGVVVFFIGFRILLRIFNANAATPFVSWIYNVSDNLIYPFRGIFPSVQLGNQMRVDIDGLIALLAYAVIISLVTAAIDAILRSTWLTTHSHRFGQTVHPSV